jgi:hypothetical protein
MPRSKPEPDPRPTDGGSYLLCPDTGKWIDQEAPAPVAPAPIAPIDALSDDPADS